MFQPKGSDNLMDTLSLAMWATNLEVPTLSLASWIDWIDARMGELRDQGCRMLVLPELACGQWLSFAPPGLALTDQVPWLAQLATQAFALLSRLATKHKMALLAGTMPFAVTPGRYTNRAYLFLPDGASHSQDKLCLTPSERNPQGWVLQPGSELRVIEWQGIRIIIAICLDIEFTALWCKIGALDVDLVLVPAKTDKLSGYSRVFGCAYARAIELQTIVCAVGAIGSPLGHPAYDTVMGGASVFAPPDETINITGVLATLEPKVAVSGASPLLFVRDIPVQAVRRIRHGAAEAEIWPSSWGADHVQINRGSKPVRRPRSRKTH